MTAPKPALPWRQRLRSPALWVIIGMVIFTAYFSLTAWFRHLNFFTAQFDLGNMDQVLWHSLHGQWFIVTSPLYAFHQLRTAIHADYLLLAYLPFYAAWPDPRMLMIVQTAAVASGAWPLWRLGKKFLTPALGLILAVAYLLNPHLERATTFDVHAVVLAAPLFLWAAWWAIERRWWLYALAIIGLLLAKEEIGLSVALFGLVMIGWRKWRIVGIITMLTGITWFILMITWAIPAARQAPGHFALQYFSEFGDSTGAVFRNIFVHPGEVFRDLLHYDRLNYIFDLLAPLGGLSILGLPIMLVASPEAGINLLSSNTNMRAQFFHYDAAILPWLFLSTVAGIWWVRRRWHVAPRLIATYLIVTTTISTIWWSPLPGFHYGHDAVQVFQPSPYQGDIAIIQKILQPHDRVAATNNIAPHFTGRDFAWAFPQDLDHADVIIVLLGGGHEVVPAAEITARTQALVQDSRFTLAYQHNDLYVFRRKV